MSPITPLLQRSRSWHRQRFRLFRVRSPLLTKSKFLSSPLGTKMFQFPRYRIPCGISGFHRKGCPIRKSTDQSLFTTPRRLSQKTTSFIASQCPGIHRMPLLTWPYYVPNVMLINLSSYLINELVNSGSAPKLTSLSHAIRCQWAKGFTFPLQPRN